MVKEPLLEIKDLSVSIKKADGNIPIIKKVNIVIPRGTIVGLVGESGSGKSMTARTINGMKNTVVSVIGDGSLTGGMAYEALNNAAKAETPFIIVLNDNNMSISENVGGVSSYLNQIRTTEAYLELKEDVKNKLKTVPKGKRMIHKIQSVKSGFKQLMIPGMYFEDMGITYLGPVNGHDIQAVVKVLKEAKRCKTPVLVHVLTHKGMGYAPAEKHPTRFHGTDPFDIEVQIAYIYLRPCGANSVLVHLDSLL